MNYAVNVRPLDERETLIRNEVELTNRKHRFYEFRNQSEDLPVVRLPIDVPVYRIANFRTRVMQLKWEREQGKGPEFCLSGEENDSVQRLQHSFLWTLAKGQQRSIASIIETLEAEGQREPLLITCAGVVVNGNRRLAAMRELYADDGERFQAFSHADCVVLPASVTEDELKEIEVRLQMTPETRLPYGWINECMAIQELHRAGRSFETIGSLMRLEATRVRDKLQMLNEVELYLSDWKGAAGDYDLLDDAEEIVAQIAARLKRKEGSDQEISRRMGWILLDERGKDGRVYELRDVVGNLSDAVAARVQEVYTEEESGSGDGEVDDLAGLEFELEEDVSGDTQTSVLSFLNSTKDDQQLREEFVNICRVVVEGHKAQKAGNLALKCVKDANTKLMEADLTSADESTYDGIARQLDSISNRVLVLQRMLGRLRQDEEE